jgi:hypothetical protein
MSVLKAAGLRISRCIGNVFVERLWRGVKYEGVYLNTYESVTKAGQASEPIFSSIMQFADTWVLAGRRRIRSMW